VGILEESMKIRFYHWMLYRLFHIVWNPIFANDLKLARHYAGMFTGWLDEMEGKNHHDQEANNG
jgi:hypothetical protein